MKADSGVRLTNSWLIAKKKIHFGGYILFVQPFLCINSTYVSFMYCTYKLLLLLLVLYRQESFCTVPIIIMTSFISTLVDLWNAE